MDYQTQLQAEDEQLNSDMVLNGSLENGSTEILGVRVEISGDVVFLSGVSVLGVIVIAIALSCISVMVQKPNLPLFPRVSKFLL